MTLTRARIGSLLCAVAMSFASASFADVSNPCRKGYMPACHKDPGSKKGEWIYTTVCCDSALRKLHASHGDPEMACTDPKSQVQCSPGSSVVCHEGAGVVPEFTETCIADSGLTAHLKENPNDYQGHCRDVAETSPDSERLGGAGERQLASTSGGRCLRGTYAVCHVANGAHEGEWSFAMRCVPSPTAVAEHLSHGDYRGRCRDSRNSQIIARGPITSDKTADSGDKEALEDDAARQTLSCPDGQVPLCHKKPSGTALYRSICAGTSGGVDFHLRRHSDDYEGACLLTDLK